jgi:hypothetical protein
MSETRSQPPIAGRVIIGVATVFWILTSPWTLQAFVPKPYFLLTPHQLRLLSEPSTPNGYNHIERSLSPFFIIIGVEVAVLLTVAVLGWRLRSARFAGVYLFAVLTMAGITLWRLSQNIL